MLGVGGKKRVFFDGFAHGVSGSVFLSRNKGAGPVWKGKADDSQRPTTNAIKVVGGEEKESQE
jgi:hypothetical protein